MAGVRQSKGDIWIGGGLLAFCAFAAWRSLKIKQGFSSSVAGPSFVPWLMIGAIAVLAIVLVLRGVRQMRSGAGAPLVPMPDRRTFLSIVCFVALLVAYAAAFFPVGYLPATVVTFVVGLWLIGERKIWVLIGFPLVMTFAVYFAFTKFLSVWLP